jgi:phage tail sheath protein FI
MATLVSAGVSVPIIDESFFIPVSAPTVPLFFIATKADKTQPDGVTTAAGTTEHSVVRTITSISQSTTMYGIPAFRTADADSSLPIAQRRQLHGDARNEYGLFALNQVLGILNRAFVVRADVDLADDPIIELVPGSITFSSVTLNTATQKGSMTSLEVDTTNSTPEIWTVTCVTGGGATGNSPAAAFSVTGSVSGVSQLQAASGTLYDNSKISFTITVGSVAFEVGDSFSVQLANTTIGSELGANDAAKRVAIVTALQAEINANQEVRSEVYEYNLIVCPGYSETVDEMLALSQDINDEAFVVADTPFTLNADDVATWSATSARKNSSSVGYYYPHGFASNLDGINVFCASSGIAMRTIAYSDSISELWFPPAGTRRGLVTGVEAVGYVTGTLGTPTTFVETNLNQGQRDNLYEYFKNINPIPFFPGHGLIVFGQKTSAAAASSLDRINVARLLMYVKRSLRKGAFPFLFEPNDQITRDNLKAAIDGFLGDILIKRGLYDFVTLCDASNNDAARIDRNELWCDVALKPVKSAEFIYIPIRILSTGSQ